MKPSLPEAEVWKRLQRGLLLEYISIAWMSIEGTASILAGMWAGSLALLAFGGDSFIELVSAIAVTAFLRNRQIGNTDPKVVWKTERITGALLTILVPTIALSAAYSFLAGIRAEASNLGIAVAIGAVLIMPGLWIGKKRIGKETNCLPLSLDAIESATCFLMSIVLLAGLLAVSLFGLWWFDYIATVVILTFVAKEAIEAFGETRSSQ